MGYYPPRSKDLTVHFSRSRERRRFSFAGDPRAVRARTTEASNSLNRRLMWRCWTPPSYRPMGHLRQSPLVANPGQARDSGESVWRNLLKSMGRTDTCVSGNLHATQCFFALIKKRMSGFAHSRRTYPTRRSPHHLRAVNGYLWAEPLALPESASDHFKGRLLCEESARRSCFAACSACLSARFSRHADAAGQTPPPRARRATARASDSRRCKSSEPCRPRQTSPGRSSKGSPNSRAKKDTKPER